MYIYFDKNMLLSIFLSLLISYIHSAPILSKTSSPPLLLVISFDGFRWDYPDIYKLPHFNSILKRGVRVKHIDNSFATVTFPSHFTMVTGLYEETHGVVANTIYDPLLKAVATINTMNDPKWWYVFLSKRKNSFTLGDYS
jgi:predicted AlkP superfamily pyrophosphatase or phosphodiesterase